MAKKVKPQRLVEVHARLLAEDVTELKRIAGEAMETNWQARLRRLVHEALRAQKVIR
jgi:hypothetical protein